MAKDKEQQKYLQAFDNFAKKLKDECGYDLNDDDKLRGLIDSKIIRSNTGEKLKCGDTPAERWVAIGEQLSKGPLYVYKPEEKVPHKVTADENGEVQLSEQPVNKLPKPVKPQEPKSRKFPGFFSPLKMIPYAWEKWQRFFGQDKEYNQYKKDLKAYEEEKKARSHLQDKSLVKRRTKQIKDRNEKKLADELKKQKELKEKETKKKDAEVKAPEKKEPEKKVEPVKEQPVRTAEVKQPEVKQPEVKTTSEAPQGPKMEFTGSTMAGEVASQTEMQNQRLMNAQKQMQEIQKALDQLNRTMDSLKKEYGLANEQQPLNKEQEEKMSQPLIDKLQKEDAMYTPATPEQRQQEEALSQKTIQQMQEQERLQQLADRRAKEEKERNEREIREDAPIPRTEEQQKKWNERLANTAPTEAQKQDEEKRTKEYLNANGYTAEEQQAMFDALNKVRNKEKSEEPQIWNGETLKTKEEKENAKAAEDFVDDIFKDAEKQLDKEAKEGKYIPVQGQNYTEYAQYEDEKLTEEKKEPEKTEEKKEPEKTEEKKEPEKTEEKKEPEKTEEKKEPEKTEKKKEPEKTEEKKEPEKTEEKKVEENKEPVRNEPVKQEAHREEPVKDAPKSEEKSKDEPVKDAPKSEEKSKVIDIDPVQGEKEAIDKKLKEEIRKEHPEDKAPAKNAQSDLEKARAALSQKKITLTPKEEQKLKDEKEALKKQDGRINERTGEVKELMEHLRDHQYKDKMIPEQVWKNVDKLYKNAEAGRTELDNMCVKSNGKRFTACEQVKNIMAFKDIGDRIKDGKMDTDVLESKDCIKHEKMTLDRYSSVMRHAASPTVGHDAKFYMQNFLTEEGRNKVSEKHRSEAEPAFGILKKSGNAENQIKLMEKKRDLPNVPAARREAEKNKTKESQGLEL